MPFPWKKVQSARISRLLNDHLHKSQKRRDGSSLVVETGFPTSLIDLFIKNREKLKTSSKKKRESPQLDVDDPVIAGSSALLPSPPQSPSSSPSRVNSQVISGLPLNCSSPLHKTSLLPLPLGLNEIEVRYCDGVGGAETKFGVQKIVDANGVILVAVKILLVAVLALGAKRLTVGITLSAFLLCFLECAGKYLRELLRPCSRAKVWFISMVQKVPKLRYKDDRVGQKKSGTKVSETQALKIEIEKPDRYPITHMDEIQPVKEIVEESLFIGRDRNQEYESSEVVIGREESLFEVAKLRRKSRKDKMKSKMKLLVPNRFWNLRKGHNFRRLKIIQEDKISEREEQGRDGCEDEWESEKSSGLSSTSSGRFKEEDFMNAIDAVGGLPEINEEVVTKKEIGDKETETERSWSYFMLCFTVLIGLIGGRVFALLLTLSWFLVLKFGKRLPRFRQAPMIKFFGDRPG